MKTKSFRPSNTADRVWGEIASRPDDRRSSARASGGEDPMDVRCHCGSLMARVTVRGIELKCRRCKRVVTVPVTGSRRGWVAVDLSTREGTAIG